LACHGTRVHATARPLYASPKWPVRNRSVAGLQRLTFKLDRFTGRTWQLVVDENDNEQWYLTQVKGGLPPSPAGGATGGAVAPKTARFQLFLSGRLARSTYLLDCQTGQTWQWTLINEKTKEFAWWPMPNVK
jgi:hypothetical protein